MFPVFKAQFMKDKRKPQIVLLFIVLSVMATLIFGDTERMNQITVAVFSTGPEADRIEEKWVDLLNENTGMKFVITEEEEARKEIEAGRSDVAIRLMEDDYRLITATTMPTIQFVEQYVHRVFTKEAYLKAAAGNKNLEKLRNDVESYLVNPPLKVKAQSLSGGEIPKHNMGIQLLFGFTLFISMFTIGFKVNGITSDKVSGVWNRLILSPVSKIEMYVGHLFYSFCIGFLQMLIVFLIFQYGLGYDLGNLAMIMVIAAVFTLSMVSLAMLMAGIAKTPEKFNMIYPSIIPILPVISGVYMPPGTIDMPILVFISKLFPLSHGVTAMMDVTLYNAGWSDIAQSIAVMLLIGVVCMGIGINLVERRNCR